MPEILSQPAETAAPLQTCMNISNLHHTRVSMLSGKLKLQTHFIGFEAAYQQPGPVRAGVGGTVLVYLVEWLRL